MEKLDKLICDFIPANHKAQIIIEIPAGTYLSTIYHDLGKVPGSGCYKTVTHIKLILEQD